MLSVGNPVPVHELQSLGCLSISAESSCHKPSAGTENSLSRARSPSGGLQAAAPAREHKGSCLSQTGPREALHQWHSQVQLLGARPCCSLTSPPGALDSHGSGDFHFYRVQQSVGVLHPETPPLRMLPCHAGPCSQAGVYSRALESTHTQGPRACFAQHYQLISR